MCSHAPPDAAKCRGSRNIRGTGLSPSVQISGCSRKPPDSVPLPSGPRGPASTCDLSPGLCQRAVCVYCGHCWLAPAGPVPAVLSRPLRFPALRSGRRCPASSGRPVTTAAFRGIALGNGLVRVGIAGGGDLRRGVADLIDPTDRPPWLGLKTVWFSVPAYQGPFIIRARRLGHPAPVALGEPPTAEALVVPPGPTVHSSGRWRTAPGGLWVRTPGCYAWQVDGLTFSEIIVVRAVLH
jgi:hypothetical protein